MAVYKRPGSIESEYKEMLIKPGLVCGPVTAAARVQKIVDDRKFPARAPYGFSTQHMFIR